MNAEDNGGCTPLGCAAAYARTDAIQLLLDHHSTLLPQRHGVNPLRMAAIGGQIQIVQFFLDKGIDINITDRKGRTPLHEAADMGHTDLVAVLLRHGANPAIKTHNGQTPLDIAKRDGYRETVKLLSDHRD